MDILQGLQGMLGGGGSGSGGGLGSMLSSGAMGRMAQSLLTNKKGDFSWLKGALLAGAGKMLWDKLTTRVGEANAAVPNYGAAPAPADDQARRLIRALVFAAKSDGHIDAAEQRSINQQIQSLNIGPEAETLVQQAMNEPLDPNLIANGVRDPQEALRLYALSSAVIDPDQFMENAYLDGLAKALNIPQDVRDQVEQQMMAQR
jgi:uncharacterized membrane protein YebE (DUF533 family)